MAEINPNAQAPRPARPGFVRRMMERIRGAFQHGVLGQSGWSYVKGYTGGDVYWDNMLASETRPPAPASRPKD
jgi:hypothetical protein